MSNITHDSSVTVKSVTDHMGLTLNANDEVKIGDKILAWCTEFGMIRDQVVR